MSIVKTHVRAAGHLRAILAAILLAGASQAHSASWTIGSGEGEPGDSVSISIDLSGDGVAYAAEVTIVLDQSRLTIDEPAGPISSASQGGVCAWDGMNKLVAVYLSGSATPFPNSPTTICEFEVKILSSAPASTVPLFATSSTCSPSEQKVPLCPVSPGAITIEAPEPDDLIGSDPSPSELPSLIVLLSNGEVSVDDVVFAARGGSPIEAFQVYEPHTIRPLITERAQDSLDRLLLAPTSAEAVAQRYLVADFNSFADRDSALAMLELDSQVTSVEPVLLLKFASTTSAPKSAKTSIGGSHRADLGIDQLWERSGGWGLVGVVDNGIASDHPDLRSFSAGVWQPHGNYLPYFSTNVGEFGQDPNDLSEYQSSVPAPDDTLCGTGEIEPTAAGHGTHVAGLVSAAADGVGVTGACKNCGLAVIKSSHWNCRSGIPQPGNPLDKVANGMSVLTKTGAQVVGISAGVDVSCAGGSAVCTQIALAQSRDVVVVAAAGNDLAKTSFPARHPDVIAVGGMFTLSEAGDPIWWTFEPTCPPIPGASSNSQCGSNSRKGSLTGPNWEHIEYLAPSVGVPSTFPPGAEWNHYIACGDEHGGVNGDGFGTCTGTSQATPQIAAILGVLRSIHPLAPVGSPWSPSPSGLRGLLRHTSSRGLQGALNDPKLGYGAPNAWRAADGLLGNIDGSVARNRAVPLFRLYNPDKDDYAAVATPQLAMALATLDVSPYKTTQQPGATFIEGVSVPGYPSFPFLGAGVPKALALVLTTSASRDGLPTPIPLYLMAWPRSLASGGDDHILVTADTVQLAADRGYALAGQQGYVYPWCATPQCNPTGTEALYLKCKNPLNNATRRCAVFLESQRGDFEGLGFTSTFPGAGSWHLGFAYPANVDADGDGLPDGAEQVIGTSVDANDSDLNGIKNGVDSDGDGTPDNIEYPFAGLPTGDPCDGPSVICASSPYRIFRSGFE